MNKHKKRYKTGILIAIILIVLSGCEKISEKDGINTVSDKTMVLSFITIGKGDAFLLKMPEGGYYMCDTGKKEDFEQIKKVLEQKQVSTLKGIFLSHGHKDHAGNLKALFEQFPTEKLYISAKDKVSYKKINVMDIAKAYGVQVCCLNGGEQLELEGVQADIWLPKGCDYKNENNNSMIIRFSYGDNACLMTGDMENGEEAALLRSGFELRADVLKLGHHGEADATSEALLEKVKPVYGLITGNAAENEASLNQTIRDRLEKQHVKAIYSESECPALDFEFDKKNITVREFAETEDDNNEGTV